MASVFQQPGSNSNVNEETETVERENETKENSSENEGKTSFNAEITFNEKIKETRKAFEKLTATVKDLNKSIEDKFNKLNQKEEHLKEISQKISSISFDDTIKLNVGGVTYQTSLQTLKKYPGSLIAEMFSAKFSLKRSDDGSFFIDRDGTHFRHILNYLRTGNAPVPSVLKENSEEILVEAEYYGLIELVNMVKNQVKADDNNDKGGEKHEDMDETCDGVVEEQAREVGGVESPDCQLSAVEEELNSFLSLLDSNMTLLEGATSHFAEMSEKLSNVHFSDIIKINVGGRIFQTTLKTLQKEPESLLASMFSKCFDLKKEDDGSYFIDHDGTHFHHILNYLRAGKLGDDDVEEWGYKILKEAEFYGLKGLERQMLEKDTLVLNIGGKKFLINHDVLRKYPESMLGKMLRGDKDAYVKRSDGTIHVDRDGTHFHHILNYIRTGKLANGDIEEYGSKIHREAEFYGLKELEKQIHDYSNVKLNVGAREFAVEREVLKKYPESMLGKMLTGIEGDYEKRRDGSFYFSRDSSIFRHILKYLTTGTISKWTYINFSRELKEEADFYNLQGLKKLIWNMDL